uniref:Carboxylic ester hydrolase n=1 Tax=Fopius arisanus TaxID=64838 RepID=A0A0C9RZ46_9HYME
MAYRSLLTVITVLWYSRGSLAEPEVITRTGVISGTSIITRRGRGVFAFRGIPYAKAPIGALRFRSPEPAEPWDGIFRANEDPVPCPQVSDDGDIIGNEDCLKLSVYTPRIDLADLLPVMVFIHGGAFVRGDISSSSLAPDFLLDHDIILVAMQYRLTALGFISTGDEVAPGNFGLKDQLLALRWVQENIENFGGDPGRVTLFGQSAGSVSVNLHVLSSQSRGLFHQFIGQSGSALCPWAFEDSTTYKDYSFSLGRNLGCPTTTSKELIDCLRNVDVGMLINDYNGFDDFRKETAITWIPTREPPGNDAFLTDLPINLILDGNLADLPNISGVVKNEGLIVTLSGLFLISPDSIKYIHFLIKYPLHFFRITSYTSFTYTSTIFATENSRLKNYSMKIVN